MHSQTGLSGQRVLVLGGSSGIGLAVAEAAIAAGAAVVLASSNRERVAAAVRHLGPAAEGHTVNLADEGAIESFFTQLGAFDHLVFTAGDSLQLSPLAATDLGAARNAFQLRFWSVLAAVKYGAPQIRPGGSIVLTTGIAGDRPQKSWTIAASICGAIVSLTRALAVELAPIRVNAVSPGIIRTNLWNVMDEQSREQFFAGVARSLPVGHVGDATEIARAYLFLLEETFSTGQTVTVDGGALLV